mmetsp:Transcript_15658/g.28433  ORF Transcript_15658/g.28433 Transcript_15658/m.28433 type:complete len:519 (+) Transcript_15658:1-1557(+)
MGTDSNTTGGGVWAQTSAKRDKLNELLTELNTSGVETGTKGMETLDEAASVQDKLDLEFADGLKMVAKFVDDGMKNNDTDEASIKDLKNAVTMGDEASLAAKNATKQMFQLLESASTLEEWEKSKFEATMHEVIRVLSTGLPPDPNLKNPVAGSLDTAHPFCYLREFVKDSEENSGDSEDTEDTSIADEEEVEVEQQLQILNNVVTQAFSSSTELYRTLLLRATAQTLLENWDTITTVTSGDIDRAAVAKTAISPQRSTVNAKNIQKLFESYSNESSKEWVQSWWDILDADGDGLIDEEELTTCVDLATKPVHLALSDMVYMSLEVCPMRTASLGSNEATAWFLGGETISDINTTSDTNPSAAATTDNKLSWRIRRRELKARKMLTKTFQATLKRHFRDQVEVSHRLRCIYAWADKSHQSNKIDSIVVDATDEWGAASSIVGRKRYVELEPKISYAEFRKEQARHFPHLDSIGEEIAMSFKEDLWVVQGKGRQNKELRRDIFLFLLSISVVDVVIAIL